MADRRVRGLYSCAAGFLFSRASGPGTQTLSEVCF